MNSEQILLELVGNLMIQVESLQAQVLSDVNNMAAVSKIISDQSARIKALELTVERRERA